VFGKINWDDDPESDEGVYQGEYKPINQDVVGDDCTLYLYPLSQLNTVEFTHVESDY
jgi:hypothetical protein